MEKAPLLSNACLMLLGSIYNQSPVTALHRGVKINLADQETGASGAGRDMAETWRLGEKREKHTHSGQLKQNSWAA